VARNTLWLSAARLGAKLLSLPLVIVLARGLGPEDFGQWALAVSLVAVLATLADGGFQTVTIRDLAPRLERSRSYWLKTLRARLWLSGLAALGLILWGLLAGRGQGSTGLYLLAGVLLFPEALLRAGQAVLNAWERMDVSSALSLIQAAGGALFVGGVVWLGQGLWAALWTLVAVNLASAGLMLWRLRPFLPGREIETRSAWRLFASAFPYGLLALLTILYFRVDVIMLASLRGAQAAGHYNAAYRLFEAGLILPAALTGALFPIMARQLAAGERGALAASFSQAVRFLVILALPAAVAMTFYAPWLMDLFFGQAYVQAAGVLTVLGWSWIFFFINAPVGNLLAASDLMPRFVPWAAANTGLNIGLNFWLIPPYGPAGAAAATLISEITSLGIQIVFARRILQAWPRLPALMARPGLAAAVLFGFWALPWRGWLNPWLSLALGLGVYVAALLAFRGLSREDRRLFRRLAGLERTAGD